MSLIRSHRSSPHWLASSLLLLGLAAPCAQAAGLPDRTFAAGGTFVSDIPGVFELDDGLIDNQGRYVGAGWQITGANELSGLVLRVTRAGAPDPSFNGGGSAVITPPPGYGTLELRAVKERPDGRLIVAGHVSTSGDPVEPRPIVCRLLATGAMDPGFGEDGCTLPPFGPLSPEELVRDIALQADGRIVLVGTSKFGNTRRVAVMRLLPNGSRDLCFNDPGCNSGGAVVAPAVGDTLTNATAVAIAPDQKIVVVGAANFASIDMVAVRLLSTGAVDMAFGNQGSRRVSFDVGGDKFDLANDVAVLSDGSIILVGGVEVSENAYQAGVAKLTPGGVPDFLFGETAPGRSLTAYTDVSIDSIAQSIAVQSDGKLVVGGTSFLGFNQSVGTFAAWRLLPGGASDLSFGNNEGRITHASVADPMSSHVVNAVAVDAGHIVLMGSRRLSGGGKKPAMLRLDQNGLFADGYE